MLINSINKTNYNIHSVNKNNHSSNPAVNSFPQIKELSDYPKSYINFRGLEASSEEKKQKIINEDIAFYLKYKDFDVKKEKQKYENNANNRIEELKEQRSYNFFLWNRKVKESEIIEIKEEERKKFAKEKMNYEKLMNNWNYYHGLVSTEDIKVYDKTKELLSQKASSMDNKVAGYKPEKEQLRELLVNPIQRETAMGTKEKVPSSILLYGPMGCGKTLLAKTVAEETGANIALFEENCHPRQFMTTLSRHLYYSRERFKHIAGENDELKKSQKFRELQPEEKAQKLVKLSSPRTVLVIDEADKYFDPDIEGNSPETAENNKTFLKGVLDHCSEKPTEEYGIDSSCLTIIFTTNRPSKIDSELTLRKGKCIPVPVVPPNEKNIADILKMYVTEKNNEMETIINEKTHPNSVKLEPIDTEQFPYNQYSKGINDNAQEVGVISCSGVKNAVIDSFENYYNNPDEYIDITLGDNLNKAVNRIPMPKLNEYQKEMDMMGTQMKTLDDKEELSLLQELKELDMIEDESQLKRLQYLANQQESHNIEV